MWTKYAIFRLKPTLRLVDIIDIEDNFEFFILNFELNNFRMDLIKICVNQPFVDFYFDFKDNGIHE